MPLSIDAGSLAAAAERASRAAEARRARGGAAAVLQRSRAAGRCNLQFLVPNCRLHSICTRFDPADCADFCSSPINLHHPNAKQPGV